MEMCAFMKETEIVSLGQFVKCQSCDRGMPDRHLL